MRKFSCLTLCAFSIVVGAWAAAPAAKESVEKSILVTVLDKGGAPIKDLTAADFTVHEDGARREVTAAALATQPLFVSVLIDTAKAPAGDVDRIRDMRTSLTTFVRTVHAASPTAQIALTTVGGAGMLVRDFTTQTNELERITSRLTPDLRENAVMLEALVDAARGLENKASPRRAIVTIDFASMERSEVQPTKVIEEILKAGASVWSVSVQGTQGRTAPRRDTALNFLTQNTGGVRATSLVPSALESILKNLADCLTAQYVVNYDRPAGPFPKKIVPSGKKGSKFLISPFVQ